MKAHSVLTEHTAKPRAAVEPDIDLTGFLNHHLKSPRLELLLDPSLSVSQSGGTDRTTSNII